MKRSILFTLLFSLSVLVSCANPATKGDVVISQDALEEEPFNILQILSDQSALWKMAINDKSAQTAEIIVDHYHFGKKQDPLLHMSTYLDDFKTSDEFTLLLAEQVYNKESKWTVAIVNGDEMTAVESSVPSMEKYPSKGYSSAPLPITANIGEEIILTSIFFTDGDESLTWHTEFEDELDLKVLEEYDHAYIVKLIIN